ncbi:MAG: sigma-70 family RNA polymerase sigma factor [Armatimonadetes bacterium]|nr:sigma-70 family RNA polymerase sigma factor [Armatimonadota bacterium]
MGRRGAGDDDLMRAVQEGDGAAFTQLMARHREWVRALIQAFVHDEHRADDLTQEVFGRVYQSRDRYAARGEFVAWLKRIAVNAAKDALRRSRGVAPLSLDDLAVRQPGLWLDPSAALQSRMLRDEVRAALQDLPDEHRLVLVMYYFGSMSVEEIAWAMKCPAGTVKSRLFHGRRYVRELLLTRWEWKEGDPTP